MHGMTGCTGACCRMLDLYALSGGHAISDTQVASGKILGGVKIGRTVLRVRLALDLIVWIGLFTRANPAKLQYGDANVLTSSDY